MDQANGGASSCHKQEGGRRSRRAWCNHNKKRLVGQAAVKTCRLDRADSCHNYRRERCQQGRKQSKKGGEAQGLQRWRLSKPGGNSEAGSCQNLKGLVGQTAATIIDGRDASRKDSCQKKRGEAQGQQGWQLSKPGGVSKAGSCQKKDYRTARSSRENSFKMVIEGLQ